MSKKLNFKRGQRVLVRDFDNDQWEVKEFDYIRQCKNFPFVAEGVGYMQCIPYQGNKNKLKKKELKLIL